MQFWVIFLWGRERSTNFPGGIIKLHRHQILCESMTGIHSVTSEIDYLLNKKEEEEE